MSKRSYEKAFERKFLNKVEIDDFHVKIDMYKVVSKGDDCFNIITSENNEFVYGLDVIKERSKSATAFDREQAFTKTELIELFANISINDVWSAQYQTFGKTKE